MKKIILAFVLVSCLSLSADDSLLGPDQDGNFVRDDVDQFIEKSFKGKNSINAAKQYAKYYTLRLLNKDNREELLKIIEKLDESSTCYRAVNPKKRRPTRDLSIISPQILNSKERVLASAKATQTLGVAAGAGKETSINLCEFKVIGM